MRSFQIVFLIFFLAIFLLSVTGSFHNLKKIFKQKTISIFSLLFWLFHFLVLTGFFYLYIYPNQPRDATNYTVYHIYNILLFSVVFFNLPMAISFILHFIFRRKRSPVIPYAGFIFSLAFAGSMLYGTLAGTRQMKIEKYELSFPNLPAAFEGYTLFLFTDTHLGGMLNPQKLFEKAIKKVELTNPDMVLFAGDLVNNFAYETEGLTDLFQSITMNRPSFSILGNHDYGDYTNWESEAKKQANFKAILNASHEMGFRLLRNENVVIKNDIDSIFIAGVENWGHPPFPQYADLDAAMEGIPDEAFTILLTHDPAHWESQVKNKKEIELTLAGHSHGLQWGIKFAGIPFSLSYLTRKYWGGMYRAGNSILYVNTGFGTVGMPWRLDMPAEITLITLKRGEID
jgi:uncharacterized protein